MMSEEWRHDGIRDAHDAFAHSRLRKPVQGMAPLTCEQALIEEIECNKVDLASVSTEIPVFDSSRARQL